MGFAGIAAGVGAATAIGGTAVSYSAAQHSAAAASAAQQQELAAQNTAFQSRISAQNQQTQEQAGVEDQGQATYLAAEQKMRAAQSQALQDKQTQLNQMNQTEQQIQDQTTQQVQNTTNAITPASLAQAQAASEAARVAGTQPTVDDIRASNPTSSPTSGSATKSALAKAMSDAADYTQTYGQNLARLGSYSAPTETTNLAATNLATNLMPAAVADKLLKAGVSARLLPSDTAYTGATNMGDAAITANTANTNERMQLASTRAQYAENLADLGQTDTNALIQTGLNVTQARDAATSALGSGLAKVGTAAIGLGASQGAFSNLGNWFNSTNVGSGISDAVASLSPSSGFGSVLNSTLKTATSY